MNHRRWLIAALFLVIGRASAQESLPWHDPSPHTVQLVTVDDNVKLEVLDWGGSGRPVVLLAGLGNTAHVFDDFAPSLAAEYHVYGITRRGYGASGSPENGYSADRLADDVLAVLDALKIERPVLVGHSLAGEELSSVGTRHPERVAGLIYLDGLNPYSYYYPGASLGLDLSDLQTKLDQLKTEKPPADQKQLIQEMLQRELPDFEKDLQGTLQFLEAAPSKPAGGLSPTPDDLANFSAFHAWIRRTGGLDFPEADLRATRESMPDGRVGKVRSIRGPAIISGEQRYTNITAPILAIYANPKEPGPYAYNTSTERAPSEALQEAAIDQFMKAFETGVPTAHVVRLPHANHYVFLSNEADVLREMRAFLATLH